MGMLKDKRRLNCKPDRKHIGDPKYAHHQEMKAKIAVYPTAVDLRPKQSPVKDQGDIGSCTGNAIASALEYLELLELRDKQNTMPEVFVPGQFQPISRLFIYYNERVIEGDPTQDNGAQIRDGVYSVMTTGFCQEATWPYADSNALISPTQAAYDEAKNHKDLYHYRIDNSQGLDQMKRSLVHGYPWVFGIAVYESFMSDQVATTGIVPMPQASEQILGGHALLCVGYDDSKQWFIVKNSWNTTWGAQGYCYIPYSYLGNTDLCSDLWTLRKNP